MESGSASKLVASIAVLSLAIALATTTTSSALSASSQIPESVSENFPFSSWQRQQVLMHEALARYTTLTTANHWQPLPSGQALKPGMQNSRILVLREQLMQYGDYPLDKDHTATMVADPDLYDQPLKQAVKRFQRRHGLQEHGLVDEQTRAQLNIPPFQRAKTLAANLRRQKKMPGDPNARRIVINLPEFTLRLLSAGREQLRMRVIVGKPNQSTPQFSTQLTWVIFNPTWTVPHSISVHELLPKGIAQIKADNYQLITQRGTPVAFSKKNLQALRLGTLALRQRGGKNNTLGRIKFIIPNRQAIFLHDTNAKHLFNQEVRALSHGCIRLELPEALAQLMLANQRNWDDGKLARMITGQRTRSVVLKNPVAIHIIYWTAWVDAQGLLHFRPDIYDFDEAAFPEKL